MVGKSYGAGGGFCRRFSTATATFSHTGAQTVLLLHNGDRLSGILLQQDEQQFVLQLAYAGTVRIQRQAVQSVSTGDCVFSCEKPLQPIQRQSRAEFARP